MKNLPANIIGFAVQTTERGAAAIEARKERGATAVEYGIMVALIAAVIITIVATLGGQLQAMFTDVSNELKK